ncbi:MAG: AMP-dependent synthetase, partial [Methylocystis sp.]|nr:AMP-dependent synthetase [Methylocystis sp.]
MFGFDALVAGAARLRPDRVALRDSSGADLTHAALERRIGAFRRRLRDLELRPFARVIVLCAADADALVALTGVIASGLEPVLAPLHLSSRALIEGARATGAVALMAPLAFGGLDFTEKLLAVAAGAPSIRRLATLGPKTIDGAVDFSAAALEANASTSAPSPPTLARERVNVGALDGAGGAAFLTQSALLAQGLDLVRRARIVASTPIVSLASPGTIAGLAAGPLAALLAGAPLHFLAPFDAAQFLAHLDAIGRACLVAPKTMLADLQRAGLLTSGALLSCFALSRRGAEDGEAAPYVANCPI